MIGWWNRFRQRDPASGVLRMIWFTLARQICWWSALLLWRSRAYGMHNVPKTGPVLLVSNHQSFVDLLAIGMPLTRHFHPMARKTLFRNAFFGRLIASLNAQPIDQEKSDMAGIRRIIDLLRDGNIALVFPEGRRTADGRIQPFQEGIMLLIRRAKPTIVPVAVEGAYDIWPIHGEPRSRGRLATMFGEPISAETLLSLPREQCMTHLARKIETMRLELRSRLRQQTDGAFPPPGPGDYPGVSDIPWTDSAKQAHEQR